MQNAPSVHFPSLEIEKWHLGPSASNKGASFAPLNCLQPPIYPKCQRLVELGSVEPLRARAGAPSESSPMTGPGTTTAFLLMHPTVSALSWRCQRRKDCTSAPISANPLSAFRFTLVRYRPAHPLQRDTLELLQRMNPSVQQCPQ